MPRGASASELSHSKSGSRNRIVHSRSTRNNEITWVASNARPCRNFGTPVSQSWVNTPPRFVSQTSLVLKVASVPPVKQTLRHMSHGMVDRTADDIVVLLFGLVVERQHAIAQREKGRFLSFEGSWPASPATSSLRGKAPCSVSPGTSTSTGAMTSHERSRSSSSDHR